MHLDGMGLWSLQLKDWVKNLGGMGVSKEVEGLVCAGSGSSNKVLMVPQCTQVSLYSHEPF